MISQTNFLLIPSCRLEELFIGVQQTCKATYKSRSCLFRMQRDKQDRFEGQSGCGYTSCMTSTCIFVLSSQTKHTSCDTTLSSYGCNWKQYHGGAPFDPISTSKFDILPPYILINTLQFAHGSTRFPHT